MHSLSNNEFKDYSVIDETEHFVLVYNPLDNPLDEKKSNYLILYKKFEKVEVAVDSYPTALQYLSLAEDALVSIHKDKNKKIEHASSH